MTNSALLVGAGGSVGAISRYIVSNAVGSPNGVTVVNVMGSIGLGVLMAQMTKGGISQEVALILGIGFLGAFTTMSAFSMDVVNMINKGEWTKAIGYFLVNAVGCPLLAFAGWRLGA